QRVRRQGDSAGCLDRTGRELASDHGAGVSSQSAGRAASEVVDQPEDPDARKEDEPAAWRSSEGRPGSDQEHTAEREENRLAAVIGPAKQARRDRPSEAG